MKFFILGVGILLSTLALAGNVEPRRQEATDWDQYYNQSAQTQELRRALKTCQSMHIDLKVSHDKAKLTLMNVFNATVEEWRQAYIAAPGSPHEMYLRSLLMKLYGYNVQQLLEG